MAPCFRVLGVAQALPLHQPEPGGGRAGRCPRAAGAMLGARCPVRRGTADPAGHEEGDVACAGGAGAPDPILGPSAFAQDLPWLPRLGPGAQQGAAAGGGCVLAAGAVARSPAMGAPRAAGGRGEALVTLAIGAPRPMGTGRGRRGRACPHPQRRREALSPHARRSSLQPACQARDVRPPGRAGEAALAAERERPGHRTGQRGVTPSSLAVTPSLVGDTRRRTLCQQRPSLGRQGQPEKDSP